MVPTFKQITMPLEKYISLLKQDDNNVVDFQNFKKLGESSYLQIVITIQTFGRQVLNQPNIGLREFFIFLQSNICYYLAKLGQNSELMAYFNNVKSLLIIIQLE